MQINWIILYICKHANNTLFELCSKGFFSGKIFSLQNNTKHQILFSTSLNIVHILYKNANFLNDMLLECVD